MKKIDSRNLRKLVVKSVLVIILSLVVPHSNMGPHMFREKG